MSENRQQEQHQMSGSSGDEGRVEEQEAADEAGALMTFVWGFKGLQGLS